MFKKSKHWQLSGLVSALMMILALACGVAASPDGPETSDAASQQQTAAREISVNGSLVFPQREQLTFDTSGKVGEILVQEGDQVTQGQVLAKLDDLSITALETTLAQAKFDRDAAERSLQAEYDDQVAKARKDLEDAQDKLKDFQRNHQTDLAQAMQAKADADKALKDAKESLGDFQIDHQQTLATAVQAKATAEDELDQLLRDVGNFDQDRAQELADARQAVADKELALETAQKDLANFDDDYQADLNNAMVKKANAEKTLEDAQDARTAFFTNPVPTARDARSEDRIRMDSLQRLDDAVSDAQAALTKAKNDLAKLQNDRQLLLQQAQAAVPQAETALVNAKDDLAKLERDVDRTLSLQKRQADYELAQAKLDQAEVDLKREMDGPDPLILQQLEAQVEAAQAKVDQTETDLQRKVDGPDQAELAVREKAVALARKKLEDLTAPDSFDVALRQSKLAAAQAKVDDAAENLEGAAIKAPLDGVISLVNVEVDDNVNDESRVLEIIDPTAVEVDGIIDAIDFPLVKEGAAATITIASLPGEEFGGTVTRVADEPRTERGVVSYPVRIAVDLPEGTRVPVSLSAVTAVILP